MFTERKNLWLAGAVVLLLVVIALANVSQSKDTDKFITRHLTEEEEDRADEEQSEAEEIRELMAERTPDVALYADPVDVTLAGLRALDFTWTGVLEDVTAGEEVRGVTTAGDSAGVASARLDDNDYYYLLAEIGDLPEPNADDFYEGWVVRREPFRFESTGELVKDGDLYVNTFGSTKDLSDHDFYVLTLEPNDGDPAPADHIVEGVLEEL